MRQSNIPPLHNKLNIIQNKMKKTLLSIAAIVFSLGAFAQTDTVSKKMFPPDIDSVNSIRNTRDDQDGNYKSRADSSADYGSTKVLVDGIIMNDGKVWLVKNNKMAVLNQTMTMNNGTKVMTDGTYTKNGKKMFLKEGEQIDMSGALIPKNK